MSGVENIKEIAEVENVPSPFGSYVTNKQHNKEINIAKFRQLWDCCVLLDAIWRRELDALQESVKKEELYPFLLLGVAHAKAQVVIDLCFSEYVAESYSILRDTIECAVHAYRLLSKPELIEVWLNHEDDPASLKAWKEEFWFDKESRLFEGLPELYLGWKVFSNFGSHANSHALFQRLFTDDDDVFALNYSVVRPNQLPLMLCATLQALSSLEARTFDKIKGYLELDAELLKMRHTLLVNQLAAFKELGVLDSDFVTDLQDVDA